MKKVPVIGEITVPPAPKPFKLKDDFQPITLTMNEVRYYMEVCDEWLYADQEGFMTSEEIMETYQLSRRDACDWAVDALPGGYWDDLTTQLITANAYQDMLWNHNQTLRQIISDLQKRLEDAAEIAKEE